MSGWIKLHRELLDKPIWAKSSYKQRSILVALLLLASHKESRWWWKGKKFVVKPGQMITSWESIAKLVGHGVTRQSIRSSLDRFKKLEFITIETTKEGSLITIINWDRYQILNAQGNPQDNQGATIEQPLSNHLQEGKNEENVRRLNSAAAYGDKFCTWIESQVGYQIASDCMAYGWPEQYLRDKIDYAKKTTKRNSHWKPYFQKIIDDTTKGDIEKWEYSNKPKSDRIDGESTGDAGLDAYNKKLQGMIDRGTA